MTSTWYTRMALAGILSSSPISPYARCGGIFKSDVGKETETRMGNRMRAITERLGALAGEESCREPLIAVWMILDYSEDSKGLANGLRRLLNISAGREENVIVPSGGAAAHYDACPPEVAMDMLSENSSRIIKSLEKLKRLDGFEHAVLIHELRAVMVDLLGDELNCNVPGGLESIEGVQKLNRYMQSNHQQYD